MKKKTRRLCLLLLALLLLAPGCKAAKDTASEKAAETDVETASGAAKAGGDEAIGERILSERETADQEKPGISIRVYHGDSAAEQLRVNTARTEEITPEILLLNLVSYEVLPDTVEVESFRQEEKDGEMRLSLELSEEFSGFLSSMGTAGEEMVMGSLVNTFLDAYGASAIQVTAAGENIETGHRIYEGWLSAYPYLEASYVVEAGNIEEEKIDVAYPQIQGMDREEVQERWNARMREKAESMAKDIRENGGTLTASYEVKTMNDELLSILVSGNLYPEGAAYPSFFEYTFNIDMSSGESIRLAHYRDVEQIAENMMNGENCTVSGELAEEFQERLTILYGSAEQLAAALRGFDFGEGQEYPAGYSWQEDGKTWICMEVPHALGDYVNIALD